jgi:hypothetical protein
MLVLRVADDGVVVFVFIFCPDNLVTSGDEVLQVDVLLPDERLTCLHVIVG